MFSQNFFSLKPKNKYQLKRSCTVLEPFCKGKFTPLCINYRGAHPQNTMLSKNTDLELYTTLKLIKEKLKGTLVQI